MFLLGCQPFFLTPCLGSSFLFPFVVLRRLLFSRLGKGRQRSHGGESWICGGAGACPCRCVGRCRRCWCGRSSVFGKPNHGSFLLPQFFLHKFSKMHHTLLFAERCLRSKLDLVRFAVRYSWVYRSRWTFFFKFCPSWGA